MTFDAYLTSRGAAHLIDRTVLERYVQDYIAECRREPVDGPMVLKKEGEPLIGVASNIGERDWIQIQVRYSRDVPLPMDVQNTLTRLLSEVRQELTVLLKLTPE